MHEFANASGCGIDVIEQSLPVKNAVRGICELLGLEPLNFANEGKLVIAVAPEAEQAVLDSLHAHPLGVDAATIGDVTEGKQVRLTGMYGTSRLLDLPHSEPLPRIC